MNTEHFIADWLEAANAFDTERFLGFWHPHAVLDDPSVGEIFSGHDGIRSYFEEYFIGYKTHTCLTRLEAIASNAVHLEVAFTGEFPGGSISGTFDLVFEDQKIRSAIARLI